MEQKTAEDKQWLDEAKEYAKSRGIDHLDFTDENYWLDYKNNYIVILLCMIIYN